MAHNDVPGTREILSLAEIVGPTCVSIYVPTEYGIANDSEINHTAFGTHVKAALEQITDDTERELFAEQFDALLEDEEFWRYQSRTLAVFATAERLRVFRLPNRLPEHTFVGDRYYIKPVLRAITFPQSAYVLALAEGSVRVVEVSADSPAETIHVPGMPKDVDSYVAVDSPNDRSPRRRLQGEEGRKVRIRQFARAVDRSLRSVLGYRGTPLILAATEPTAGIYRSVTGYEGLLSEGIDGSPEGLSDEDLAARSRTILDGHYRTLVAEYAELFDTRTSQGRTQVEMSDLGRSATWGQIDTLFVDIDSVVAGTVDDEDGTVTLSDENDPVAYGVVDEIARRTLLSSGRVVALRQPEIPGGGPASAILRYAPWPTDRDPGSGPRSLPDSGDERGLTGVLEIVAHDTHESHPERDRRIPRGVDDAIEIVPAQRPQVRDGARMHRVVIAQQQIRRDVHLPHVVRRVPESDVGQRERQRESIGPAVRDPDLVVARGVGDVIVLHAGEMPGQPRDRVRVRIDVIRQGVAGQPVEGRVHRLRDAVESIFQQLELIHSRPPFVGAVPLTVPRRAPPACSFR